MELKNYFEEENFLDDFDEIENENFVHSLVIEGNIEKLDQFLKIEVKEKIIKEKQTNLIEAKELLKEDIEQIKLLNQEIEELKFIYVNYEDSKFGLRPLHLAVISSNLKMVKYLIDMKADATLQDHYGATACKKFLSQKQSKILKGYQSYSFFC